MSVASSLSQAICFPHVQLSIDLQARASIWLLLSFPCSAAQAPFPSINAMESFMYTCQRSKKKKTQKTREGVAETEAIPTAIFSIHKRAAFKCDVIRPGCFVSCPLAKQERKSLFL